MVAVGHSSWLDGHDARGTASIDSQGDPARGRRSQFGQDAWVSAVGAVQRAGDRPVDRRADRCARRLARRVFRDGVLAARMCWVESMGENPAGEVIALWPPGKLAVGTAFDARTGSSSPLRG